MNGAMGRRFHAVTAPLGLALALTAGASQASQQLEVRSRAAEETPAVSYARLDAASCARELTTRGIPFTPVETTRGVLAPIRLTGPVRGVSFHGVDAPAKRATSPYEILDCRLALALDDFARILQSRGVREVVHLSLYRPPAAKGWAPGRIGGQHAGGLAIDAAAFKKVDGTTLDVDRDFAGRIGDTTCGHAAVQPRTVASSELRAIVCAAAEQHLFNVTLTPDFNQKHKNHFHLEVTANVGWFMVR
jgi:hypothetical protein